MPTCRHCKLSPATETFTSTMCADSHRKRTIALCAACDLQLNSLVMEFCRIPGRTKALAAYAREKVL